MKKFKIKVSRIQHTSGVDVLLQCLKIREERGKQYGKFKKNLEDTVKILEADFGKKMSKADVLEVIIANKRARQKFKHKLDNFVDEINYVAELADELKNESKS